MDINFEYYKIFYFVAKYKNITRAAAALRSSQPNVTRVMKLLEAQLGCRLFVREARGISLTEEGERLCAHVEIAYRHLRCAQEELCKREDAGSGTVEIGATETAIHLFLLHALRGFQSAYPAIRIRIHNHTTPGVIRQLTGGTLDFAVITTPFELPKDISGETVQEFREILVGGTQYGRLCGASFGPEDIKRYPWVGLGKGSATYELYRDFFIGHKVDAEPDLEVETSNLMLPLIEQNFGIGFVPEALAFSLLEEGKLVQIPFDCELPKRSVQLVLNQGRGSSPAADTCRQYLLKMAETS